MMFGEELPMTLVRWAMTLFCAAGSSCTDAPQPDCEDVYASMAREVSELSQAQGACAIDDDCVLVPSDVRCGEGRAAIGDCGIPVNRSNVAATEAAWAVFTDNLCADVPSTFCSRDVDCGGDVRCLEGVCGF